VSLSHTVIGTANKQSSCRDSPPFTLVGFVIQILFHLPPVPPANPVGFGPLDLTVHVIYAYFHDCPSRKSRRHWLA